MFFEYSNAAGFNTSPITLTTFEFLGINISSPSNKIVFLEEEFGEKSPAILPKFSGAITTDVLLLYLYCLPLF